MAERDKKQVEMFRRANRQTQNILERQRLGKALEYARLYRKIDTHHRRVHIHMVPTGAIKRKQPPIYVFMFAAKVVFGMLYVATDSARES